MADWEEDDFTPVAPALILEPIKSQWADEDVDEDEVKESWEDDDEPVKETKPEPAKPKPSGKGGAASKKGKEPESKTVQIDDEVLSDPVAEKLRQQRLIEEADYKFASELFKKKGGDDKNLENFIPISENDFMEYAELISHKIRPYEKSYHYNGLLKAVIRLSMTNLKAADAKDIASSVNAISNEKIKLEKDSQAGKKKGAKKKQLIVEKGEEEFVPSGKYDEADDYDFM